MEAISSTGDEIMCVCHIEPHCILNTVGKCESLYLQIIPDSCRVANKFWSHIDHFAQPQYVGDLNEIFGKQVSS